MTEPDNLDRQILGYISQYPAAMYAEIADALGCQKVIITNRIQQLYTDHYITILESGIFQLTETAFVERSFTFDGPAEADSWTEFHWEDLYIPVNLSL